MEFLNLKDPAAVAEYEAFNRACPKGHFAQSVGWGKLKSDRPHHPNGHLP